MELVLKKGLKKKLLLFVLFVALQNYGQTDFKGFFELSFPKKMWVLKHPFKAKKALKISTEAQKVSDSIAKTNLLDGDANGGQVDAFRHAYWMARLRQEIGKGAALSLGRAHEKENYNTFKKQQLEDGYVPDQISSEMDLYNNQQGVLLVSKNKKTRVKGLLFKVINAVLEGKMKIIKKDTVGNFLTCQGEKITSDSLKGKWENSKCLVASNSIQ